MIGTALTLVLLYGLLYWAIEGVVPAHAPAPLTLWRAVYFSGITFATVGYGDFLPAPHARLLALTEGVLGAFTMGFFCGGPGQPTQEVRRGRRSWTRLGRTAAIRQHEAGGRGGGRVAAGRGGL